MKKLIALLLISTQAFAAYNPNNPNGQATMANSQPVVVSSDQSTLPISAASLPLPAGASTAGGLTTINTTLGSPFQTGGSIGNSSFGISGTLPAFGATPTVNLGTLNGAATAANQSTANTSLSAIQTSVANIPASPATAGNQTTANTSLSAIQTSVANIPASPATAGNQTTANTSLASIVTNTTSIATASNQSSQLTQETTTATNTGRIPAQGNAAASASLPVVQSNATQVVTAAFNSSTGTINTDMLTGNASGWYDAGAFNQWAITIYTTTTVTAGVISFETTDDTTNDASGVAIFVQQESGITQLFNTTSGNLVASSVLRYRGPISKRYVRLRFSTAFTGTGTVGATVTFKQTPYAPIVTSVNQATGSSLNVATAPVNFAIPTSAQDIVSAAITVTTTSSAITPTYGNGYQINVPVTVVAGTGPTLDIEVQESRDAGTNWVPIYDFPRITATGSYNSPAIMFTGNRIRYVRTIGGTGSPSFTMALNRFQIENPNRYVRQIVDRTVTLTSLNSTTATLNTESQVNNLMLTIDIGATTIAPSLQLQCSDDAGATYYKIGSPLTGVASSTVSATVTNSNCQMVQAIVTTAGTGTTAGYVLIRGF